MGVAVATAGSVGPVNDPSSNPSSAERTVNIGLLGCGNVGAALVELVRDRGDEIAARTGLRLDVTRVAVRSTFRGTHENEFAGIPATGNEVEIPVFLIYRIEDGLIAEHWMQADVMGLMQQLGALPAPEEAS